MGILKKKRKQAEKPTKAELQSILADYKRQTAEITDETAMDMMDTEKKNDFLLLLKVADYAHMGKSRAILAAFKLGYLQGKTAHEPGIHGLGFQNILSGVALKLEKAITVLRTIMQAGIFNQRNKPEIRKEYGCLDIAGDYINEASGIIKELREGLQNG